MNTYRLKARAMPRIVKCYDSHHVEADCDGMVERLVDGGLTIHTDSMGRRYVIEPGPERLISYLDEPRLCGRCDVEIREDRDLCEDCEADAEAETEEQSGDRNSGCRPLGEG